MTSLRQGPADERRNANENLWPNHRPFHRRETRRKNASQRKSTEKLKGCENSVSNHKRNDTLFPLLFGYVNKVRERGSFVSLFYKSVASTHVHIDLANNRDFNAQSIIFTLTQLSLSATYSVALSPLSFLSV